MDPLEIELKGQIKLKGLFGRLKEGLVKGEIDPGVVDQIEILVDELSQNRQALSNQNLDEEKKRVVNSVIAENQRLFKSIMELLDANLSLVAQLKELVEPTIQCYRPVGGKLIVK